MRRWTLTLGLLSLIACHGSSPTTPGPGPGPGPGPADNPWGVSNGAGFPSPLTSQAFELAAQAGIGFVRFAMGQGRVEPQPGVQNYAIWDAVISRAVALGLRPLVQIGWPPPWNSTAPPGAGEDAIFYPPKSESAWRDFVARTVARYPDVLYWEFWNEPDLLGAWRGTPAQYAYWLGVTARAVRGANPRAKVVLGGLALGGQRLDPNFLEDILGDPQYPAGPNFDVMNFHVYRPERMGPGMDYVRSTLARFGAGDKPIWVTETGYPSDPTEQWDPRYRGPEGQAQWLRDHLPYLRSLGAAKVFWFKLHDADNDSGIRTYGLLDSDGRPKPAYDAYRDLIRSIQ
ncbi:Beta-xylosidase [bacterium HR11]|nr:Beta-xylosidase [bacterium HR11]